MGVAVAVSGLNTFLQTTALIMAYPLDLSGLDYREAAIVVTKAVEKKKKSLREG